MKSKLTPTLTDLINLPSLLAYDLSPSGDFIIYSSNINGDAQLFFKNTKFGSPEQITFSDNPITNALISPQGNQVLFLQDNNGDELTNLFLLHLDSKDIVKLTNEAARCFGITWSPNQKSVFRCIVSKMGSQIESVELGTKKTKTIYNSSTPLLGVQVSPDGNWVGTTQITDNHTRQVVIFNINSPELKYLYKFSENSSESSLTWAPNQQSIALISDKSGFSQFYICDFPPKKITPIPLEPSEEIDTDCLGAIWGPSSSKIFFQISNESQISVSEYDFESETRRVLGFPKGFTITPKISSSGNFIVASHSSTNSPTELYGLDLNLNILNQLTNLSHEFDFSIFPDSTSAWYESFDGKKIHGWYLPPKNKNHDSPAIIYLHGGPFWQHFNSFELGQVFMNFYLAGYACFAPNIRGSTGYGTEFKNLNKGDIGGDDLKDVIYATKWLKSQPGIDAAKIGVYGASYGGYLTLMALTKYPDHFCLGASMVPIVDWKYFYTHSDLAYRVFAEMLLGGSFEDFSDLYFDRSPINHIENIKVPVLIGAAKGDSRCPFEPIEIFANKLKEKNHPCQLITQDNVGHDSMGAVQGLQEFLWSNLLEFLSTYMTK